MRKHSFQMRKLCLCKVKVMLLQGKTYAFTGEKGRFCAPFLAIFDACKETKFRNTLIVNSLRELHENYEFATTCRFASKFRKEMPFEKIKV